ncbi:S8 family serine peptidase [Pseudoalteromonas piscicida]|uniref:S8 family serine peptidase n=1 Tax=Pseudoalteromonas piscicida TaxID=43662 RepID=UPI0030C99E50
MKKTTIATGVSAALFCAGSLYALESEHLSSVLQAPSFNLEDIRDLQSKLYQQEQPIEARLGLNVNLNTPKREFVNERIAGEHVYIVRLRDASVAIAADELNSTVGRTRYSASNKLFQRGQAISNAIKVYESKLIDKQEKVIDEISMLTGRTKLRHRFTKAINGFSMKMTEQEAMRIASLGSVASVIRSKNYDLLSDEGHKQIKADQVWSGAASSSGVKYKGEGQIIGIIDTGINSDHPSFADISGDGYDHTNPWGAGNYVGDCVEEAELIRCNDKLIGVRSYDVITDSYSSMIPDWPAIGEDYQGHGSHVASTAAGNVIRDVPYMVAGTGDEQDGKVIKDGLFTEISGVAPRANIVAYQVCHSSNNSGYKGCPGEALVAGIEDAISDGVDVINFSIGGADSNVWEDPVQLAFLSARKAGINVAAAAGNDGTGVCGATECLGYLDNSSPWLTQVAATTHGRTVEIATPVEYAGFIDPSMGSEIPGWANSGIVGGSINKKELTGVVVWAKDYVDVSGTKDSNGYCVNAYPAGTFDFFNDGTEIPGAVEGETNVIVICQRHDPQDPDANARTAKVENIKSGGADGFILYNKNKTQSTVAESYSIPSVHFTYDQWHGTEPNTSFEDWIDSRTEKGHMITINPTKIERHIDNADADWLADFSSRGPSFDNIEVLAPTLAAPGVSIYAAYSDEHPFVAEPYGMDYSLSSGTSMASPHVAGAMALIRQAHPEWSASEVQSALAMTADNTVKYYRLNQTGGEVDKAQIYRAGAGRINVANAVKSGLVMDETADNFLAADPFNGGTPHKLNMPNLVNFACAPECQWIRTVKATRDGTWNVSHEDVVNWAYDMRQQSAQNGVNIEILPDSFSLKAGESQTIIVKASVMDTQDWFSNSEVELHTNLVFKAQDASIPQAHWPVAFKYNRGELPSRLKVTAHANSDNYTVKGITLPLVDAPKAQVYQPVKADLKTVTIPKDDDRVFPWALHRSDEVNYDDIIDEAVHVGFVTVPTDAKRLIVELQSVEQSELKKSLKIGNPGVFVGKDYNGDGIIQPQDEILCVSNHTIYPNFCNINNPEKGEYWYMLYNNLEEGYAGLEETFKYAVAVVDNQVSSEITASFPTINDVRKADMEIAWNLEMTEGETYYSSIDVGSSVANRNNLGSIPIKLERGVDRVNLDVPQTQAKVGDTVPFTFEVLENNTGQDRKFVFSVDIPEGLHVDRQKVLSSRRDVEIDLTEDKLVISGIQKDTRDVTPDYIVTNNISDEFCKVPDFGNSNPGGYVDLREFGLMPIFSGFDEKNQINYRKGYEIPVKALFDGSYENLSLYNNSDKLNTGFGLLTVRPNGKLDFGPGPQFFPFHDKYPYENFPYEGLSALWRGWFPGYAMDIMSLGLSPSEGITLATTPTGWGIVEWDNAADYGDATYDQGSGQYQWQKRDNSFDFEVIFNANTRFGDNEHEIYFAYDNIDFGSTDNRGSIGIQGFRGALYSHGPLEGYLGRTINFNEVNSVVKDGMVVCLDYVGPESSKFEITVWADITSASVGREMNFVANIDVDGMASVTKSHKLSVPSNITLAPLDDMETAENESLSFKVHYIDEYNSNNEILVTGEHIGVEVNGDNVTIQPETDFYGNTNVTVTVSDIENPSDRASTSFNLKVISDGKEPPVVIKPEPETKSSSGSLAWLLLFGPIAWFRNRLR